MHRAPHSGSSHAWPSERGRAARGGVPAACPALPRRLCLCLRAAACLVAACAEAFMYAFIYGVCVCVCVQRAGVWGKSA